MVSILIISLMMIGLGLVALIPLFNDYKRNNHL